MLPKEPLGTYFDLEKPVGTYVRELADTATHPTHATKQVKVATLGLVQRYLLDYMEVRYATGISSAQRQLQLRTSLVMGSGFLARSCLFAVHQTAALVRELAFTPVPLNADRSVEIADIGTGSGILALASVIGAMRSGAQKIVAHCIESDAALIEQARGILSKAVPDSTFSVRQGDGKQKELYDSLPVERIRAWVSETINGYRYDLRITPTEATHSSTMNEDFPVILNQLLQNVPNIHADIMSGRSILFPNPITGDYRTDDVEHTLRLHTSVSHRAHGPLHAVGQDFKDFEPFTDGFRWG